MPGASAETVIAFSESSVIRPGPYEKRVGSMPKKRITFDFETRSECDLKKTGAFKYSLDPTTRPTCMAWRCTSGIIGEGLLVFKVINQNWSEQSFNFRNIWTAFIEEGYEFSAYNAFFERCIYQNILVSRYGWPEIPARQYRCTAAKAAACALPRNLQGAGEAMKLSVQKDRRGYAAMMATCKPTKAWKKWNETQERVKDKGLFNKKGKGKWEFFDDEPPMFLEYKDAPHVWEVLYEYCRIDVKAEEALDDALPDLSNEEQEAWFLNQEMNWRGLRIDTPVVKKIIDMMAGESKKKLKELDSLTMGFVTSPHARNSVLDFLEMEGVKLPNLQAKTVQDKLEGFELSTDMRKLLELRKQLSLTSTRKYQSFLNRVNEDDRIRDLTLYHGAHTGRETGTGIQPHNFPKGLIFVDEDRPYAAVENIKDCDPELLKILYGNSLSVFFSAVLRNMILPSEGCELFVGDFSMIEVAVLWWLAGNEPGLKALRAGMDAYLYQAAANAGRPYVEFNRHSPERVLGKAQVLGCGFGMGADKFKETAWVMHRLKLSDEQAVQAVQNYRHANAAVPTLWKAYENAAVMAVEAGTRGAVNAGKCQFFIEQNFLWIELPSGRRLAYREPQIAWRETDYGPRKTLEYHAVNSKTKKWGIQRTWGGTLTENIVQAVARDLLMRAMVRLTSYGYTPLLTVHDEAICEMPIGKGNLDQFLEVLCAVPRWAIGCPIKANGWKGPRYRK